ncbi:MAG: hypothetical protein DWQ10_05745 [Calditrichaeota bacterium]|nr:MAG: hypothetical protein DWQ10_05745 [Calditrichota bacterium]
MKIEYIAVGYRVRSHRGTQLRRWATERPDDYVVREFAMDDELLNLYGNSVSPIK